MFDAIEFMGKARAPLAVLAGSALVFAGIPDFSLRVTGQEIATRPLAVYGLGEIRSVAFSPDGGKVLLAAAGNAYMYDVANGRQVRVFSDHAYNVSSVAVSPEGTKLLTASWDGTAKLWGMDSGRPIQTFSGHTGFVTSVAFSPDGTRMITGASSFYGFPFPVDSFSRIWDISSGQLLRILDGHSSGISSVAFSPDGMRVLTGSGDNTAKIWNVQSGQELGTFIGHTGLQYTGVNSVAFSPSGTEVLTGAWDHTAKLWDATTGQVLRTFTGHTNGVTSLAFSPDALWVLTGSRDGTVRLWNARTGQLVRVFSGHTRDVTSVAFSRDGSRIVSGSDDATSIVWETMTGQAQRTLGGYIYSAVTSVALSSDGSQVLMGDAYGTAHLWDVVTARVRQRFSGHEFLSSLCFSPDGMRVLTAGESTRIWNSLSGQVLLTLNGAPGVFSPDGTTVISGSREHTAKLWDSTSGAELRTFVGHTESIRSIAFSPSGSKVISGGGDNTARLWDLSSARELRAFDHPGPVNSVAVSADETTLMTEGQGSVRLWNTETGELLRTFTEAAGFASVALSTDGRWLFTGSGDFANGRLWESATGQILREFRGHGFSWYGGYSVAFSRDGATVLTGSGDGSARLWDIEGRTDTDGDGRDNLNDNCPSVINPDQGDFDNDNLGDECDSLNQMLGDMNCDGIMNAADVGPIILGLLDPAAYAAAYPQCSATGADVNSDGRNDGADIASMVDHIIVP